MALVLTRRTDEGFLVGENVVIRVVEVRNGNVRLSIEAPRSIAVDREEVRHEIRRQGRRRRASAN